MRKRTFILILLPVFIIVWFTGWFLYHVGSKDYGNKHQQVKNAGDSMEIVCQFPDERIVAED